MTCRRAVPVAISLLATLTGLGLVIEPGAPPLGRGPGPYVLTSFLGHGQDGLHLAYSRDGFTFEPVAEGPPVMVPAEPRHGTVLAVSDTILKGLLAHKPT